MAQCVIKGRNENKGKYLCRSRVAGLPPGTFVYLPEQRKAARWDEHRCRRDYHEWNIAREHDGYFVRLVCKSNVRERVGELEAYISNRATTAKERPNCYWLDGDWSGDEGPDYCWDCACKEVDTAFAQDPQLFVKAYGNCHGDWKTSKDYYRVAIDGGWSMDHDSTRHCEGCGIQLAGTLTDHGADKEIRALTTDCSPSFGDVEGWYCLDIAVMNLRSNDPRWNKIARVVDAAMAEEQKRAEHEAVLAASPGMAEARLELLGLLAVRKEQKAPEPSYRLWNEFLEWRRERAKTTTPKDAELEKRLIVEAKSFANDLGYEAYWGGELFMIKAIGGTFYWPFVVMTEQYRLWKPKAFMEGRAHWHNGDKTWRDGNPYAKGSDEHLQWDCGYMSAEHPLT